MANYIARWPNGDFSIVAGKNRLEIDEVLDEVGDPGFVKLFKLDHAVAVHFRMLDKPTVRPEVMTDCFEFDGWDEQSLGVLWTAYPVLDEACDDSAEPDVGRVMAAMETERFAIHVKPEISSDPQLAQVQKFAGISRRMVENYKRIADNIEADSEK